MLENSASLFSSCLCCLPCLSVAVTAETNLNVIADASLGVSRAGLGINHPMLLSLPSP